MIIMDQSNYIYLDDPEEIEELKSVNRNHEKEIQRKQLFESLSGEAKMVIRLILQAPQEVIEELKKINLPGYQNYYNGWMQTGGFSSDEETAIFKKERIASFLRKKLGKRIVVRRIMEELEDYANELGTL